MADDLQSQRKKMARKVVGLGLMGGIVATIGHSHDNELFRVIGGGGVFASLLWWWVWSGDSEVPIEYGLSDIGSDGDDFD